ncbi:MAG: glycoside hydrolase family 127 protein, partial [Chitinophagaceae bacterium]|nr:glycoside hydrolase family 127 protein [Chitinophagaceae bacterium]
LVASLLGPSELNTSVDGKAVTIKQETNYPFSNSIVFEVKASDAEFTLKIRKPAWATSFKLSTAYVLEEEYIVVRKKWKGTEKVKLDLMAAPRVEQDINNEYYFTYGPLVLAHALPATAEQTKSFPLKGFSDLMYTPSRLVVYTYDGKPIQQVKNKKLLFKTIVFNPTSKKQETITLRPVAQTILRQVTFKEK